MARREDPLPETLERWLAEFEERETRAELELVIKKNQYKLVWAMMHEHPDDLSKWQYDGLASRAWDMPGRAWESIRNSKKLHKSAKKRMLGYIVKIRRAFEKIKELDLEPVQTWRKPNYS